jgi:hypothetical protein
VARKEAPGDVQAKTGYYRGHAHKIPELQQFTTFVATQGDATVEEWAEAWGGVGRMTIWRQLHKLGYTHKKRPSGMLRETKHGGSSFARRWRRFPVSSVYIWMRQGWITTRLAQTAGVRRGNHVGARNPAIARRVSV